MAQTLKNKYDTWEEENLGKDESVTAFVGGGQGDATLLAKKWNEVSVCASNGDSVKLSAAKVGLAVRVFNSTNKNVSVFPQSGEMINGVTDDEITLFPGNVIYFDCPSTGKWFYLNTAI